MDICENRECPAFPKCNASYRGSACAATRNSYGLDYDPAEDCDFCSENMQELCTDNQGYFIRIVDGRLTGHEWDTEINYCPMCGRKL